MQLLLVTILSPIAQQVKKILYFPKLCFPRFIQIIHYYKKM